MTLTEPRTRARAFAWNVGLLVAWAGLGTAIAGATSTGLEERWGFQRLPALRAVLVLGAIGSIASVALFRALHPPAGAAPAAALQASNLSPHAIRQMLPLIGLVAVWMLGPALAAPFFNIFFSRVHGLAIERIGFIFAAANLGWALVALASGEVASRVGGRRVLVASLLWFAPAMCGLALAGTLQLAVVLYVLQGAIGPVTNPLIDQWLLGQTPRERQGLVSSWRQAAADASAMIGASVGGQLLARGGFDPLLLVAGAIGLVGAVGLIVGVHRRSDEP
jgi:predicted MFS family arabinose efflux permease